MKTLAQVHRCFQGVTPALIATCSKDGIPNVTYVSQIHYLDPKHVALSCQFFNKTKQNVAENPYATIQMHDPVTYDAYRLELRFGPGFIAIRHFRPDRADLRGRHHRCVMAPGLADEREDRRDGVVVQRAERRHRGLAAGLALGAEVGRHQKIPDIHFSAAGFRHCLL